MREKLGSLNFHCFNLRNVKIPHPPANCAERPGHGGVAGSVVQWLEFPMWTCLGGVWAAFGFGPFGFSGLQSQSRHVLRLIWLI